MPPAHGLVLMTTTVPSRSRTHKVSIWPGSYRPAAGPSAISQLRKCGVRPGSTQFLVPSVHDGAVRHVGGGGALECFAGVAVDGDVRRGGHVGHCHAKCSLTVTAHRSICSAPGVYGNTRMDGRRRRIAVPRSSSNTRTRNKRSRDRTRPRSGNCLRTCQNLSTNSCSARRLIVTLTGADVRTSAAQGAVVLQVLFDPQPRDRSRDDQLLNLTVPSKIV